MWYKLTELQKVPFDKEYCYAGMRYTITNRYMNDNTILNVKTNTKISLIDFTKDIYNTDEFPLFGRKMGFLNKRDGYTLTGISFKKSTDGFWCTKQKQDVTIPEKLDDDGNIIRPEIIVPFSTFYDNCIYESTTTTEPIWINVNPD